MDGNETIRIEKVAGDGEDALFNVIIDKITVMKAVPMHMVLVYLSNIHEDEPID